MISQKDYEPYLVELRAQAIKIIESFEGKNNLHKKDYYKKLNSVINKKIGSPIKVITKCSIVNSLTIFNSEN